jgi:dipeptidase E
MTTGKLLLTSAGITNASIRQALTQLLGKPIHESSALFVPTAIYAYPGGIKHAWQVVKSEAELEWKAWGVLELTALPSLPRALWQSQLEETDAIIVGGGNKFYLSYWMQASGLFDLLPRLLNQGKVYVGMSAGSMMLTSGLNFDAERLKNTGTYYDDEFDETMPANAGSTRTLNLVDFVIRPHLGADYFPQATLANMERWAAKAAQPLYALDDQSALKISDGTVAVVSEGEWKLFGQH